MQYFYVIDFAMLFEMKNKEKKKLKATLLKPNDSRSPTAP